MDHLKIEQAHFATSLRASPEDAFELIGAGE